MQELIIRWEFWVACVMAILTRSFISETELTTRAGLTSGIIGLGLAAVFTEPLVLFMEWDFDTYAIPTACILTFTIESLARILFKGLQDLSVVEILKIWRGK